MRLSHTMTRAGANERDIDLAKVCRGPPAHAFRLLLAPDPPMKADVRMA